MDTKTDIVRLVEAAKTNTEAADELISAYLPFIKAQTEKFLKRPPQEGRDDELSIALIAFHEAISGYSSLRGSFLHYAGMLIKSRLIDHARKEQRHRHALSLDAPIGEETEGTLLDTIHDPRDHYEEQQREEAFQREIAELSKQLRQYDLCFADVADNCPRQQRTLDASHRALAYAKTQPALLMQLVESRRLPIAKLSEGSQVERKTLERHRKYLVALLLIHTNGYEMIRTHLMSRKRGVEA